MENDLTFLVALVRERTSSLRSALPAASGHGASLVEGVQDACSRLEADAARQAHDDAEVAALVRRLHFALGELELLHYLVARFKSDVGRTDLPVGLLHLVDELIDDLLPQKADPILHLDDENMYSTIPLFQSAPSILRPERRPLPHPVAFNVPGLDPGNAMFAPILAHEVGHTSWEQGVADLLEAETDNVRIEAALRAGVTSTFSDEAVRTAYDSWREELMCDALAATLTGPGFLFALATFLPATAEGDLSTHPYPRDRLAFTLRILDNLGWTPVIEAITPQTLAWCQSLAGDVVLTGSAPETALRQAMGLLEPTMIKVAMDVARNRTTSEDFAAVQDELFAHLQLSIPPAQLAGLSVNPWSVITAGWLYELSTTGQDTPAALPRLAGDPRLNAFLLKTIELSGIVRLWSAT